MVKVIGFSFALAIVWGLLSFASTETVSFNRFYLGLLLVAGLAFWFLPVNELLRGRLAPGFLCLGAFLLFRVATIAPVERAGYVRLSIGWLVAAIVILLSLKSRSTPRIFVLFVIALGLCQAGLGLVQSIGGWDYIGNYERNMGRMASGTFVNPNHLAGFLNLCIPLTIGVLFATYTRYRQKSEAYSWAWIVVLVASFIGLAVVFSLSRAGILSLILTLLFMAYMLRSRTRSGNSLSGSPAVLLLFIILMMSGWLGLDAVMQHFRESGPDTSPRFTVYRDSLRLIDDHPLGVGPGMYRWHFRRYQSENRSGGAGWWTHAHNDYLETTSEWGVPLSVVFWAFLFWTLLRNRKTFLESRDPWSQGLGHGCAGAFVSILLHSLADFNLQIPATWAVFCALAALSWMIPWNESRTS